MLLTASRPMLIEGLVSSNCLPSSAPLMTISFRRYQRSMRVSYYTKAEGSKHERLLDRHRCGAVARRGGSAAAPPAQVDVDSPGLPSLPAAARASRSGVFSHRLVQPQAARAALG